MKKFAGFMAACFLLVIVFACSAGGSSSDGNKKKNDPVGTGKAGDGKKGGAEGGKTSPVVTALTGATTPLASRLGNAAAACGYQSRLTVPAGWEFAMIGDRGCSVSVPPGWSVTGSGTSMLSLSADGSGLRGFNINLGQPVTPVGECTVKGISDFFLAAFEAQGCADAKFDWYQESVDPTAAAVGLTIPRSDGVFGCRRGADDMVGYMGVELFAPAICSMLVSNFWMPQGEIEARTCTMTQILNSYQCPQASGGGDCTEDACRASCSPMNGYCGADGGCHCY